MKPVKIMPCLDMKDSRVVKGINFIGLRDAGDPVENAVFYDREGADELALLDIAATLENRTTRLEWVRRVSSVVSMPVTVGGGMGSLRDIGDVLEAGASRVSINSAAVKSPGLVSRCARRFGTETLTVAIDGKRNPSMPSGFEVVVTGGTRGAGIDAVSWAARCADLGAGSLLVTSMDGDGTLSGYDIELTSAVSRSVDIPVIASGGAGRLEHFSEAVTNGGASILLAASVFHFRTLAVGQVKKHLKDMGIKVDNRVEK